MLPAITAAQIPEKSRIDHLSGTRRESQVKDNVASAHPTGRGCPRHAIAKSTAAKASHREAADPSRKVEVAEPQLKDHSIRDHR